MNKYTAGVPVETTANFTDDNNIPLDPTSVFVTYEATNAVPTTVNYSGSSVPGTGYIYRLGTGIYRLRIDSTTLLGYLIWAWYGQGGAQTVGPNSAIIYPNTPIRI